MTSDAEANAEANALFWKAYATSILKMMTGGSTDIGPDSRVFIASSNHSALPGGKTVPQPITNNGIYNLANNLLDPSNGITFNPNAASGGYVAALASFLDNIKLPPTNVDPQNMAQLQAAQEAKADAEAAFKAASTDVIGRFDALNLRVNFTLDFASWYPHNKDPDYDDALRDLDAAKGRLELESNHVLGSGLAEYNEHLKLLQDIQVGKSAEFQPGMNMMASLDDITMDAANFALSTPKDLSVFTVPAYTITGYGEVIDGWMLTDMRSKAPAFTSTISASAGGQYDAKSFGHSDSGGDNGFNIGVFGVGGGGGTSTDSSSFQLGQCVDDLTLTLSANFAETMTITPGGWNFDVNNLVKKMGAGLPDSVKTSVRPTQALFASGIGLKVKFGASAATQFDTYYRQNKVAGGGFSIFGFHFGGEASSSVTQVNHNHTWDGSTGTLSIEPVPTAHNAQLLAVMGELVTL